MGTSPRFPSPCSVAPPALGWAAGSGAERSGLSISMEEDEFFGEKTFQRFCAEFIKHSRQIGDGWEWRTSKDCSEGYMCKTYFQIKPGTVVSHLGTSAHVQTCLPTEEALELPLDDFEVTETTTGSEVIKYEYHVLYSCSYQVPVLYFRASFLDGRPLALKDIWEGIHECYKTRMLQEPWDTITQQAATAVQVHDWDHLWGRTMREKKRERKHQRISLPQSSSTHREPFSWLSGQRGVYPNVFVVYASYTIPQWDNPWVKARREKKKNQGTYSHGSFSSSLLLFPICYYCKFSES
ncbi:ubiquitin-like-conjugating enzyme ATG10 isoform X2 [Halichoerus grypus]